MRSHMTGTIQWGCFNMGSFCCHERRPLLHWLCHGIGPRIALRPDEQWPMDADGFSGHQKHMEN